MMSDCCKTNTAVVCRDECENRSFCEQENCCNGASCG